MKTLYININNEQIQSNEELEVLDHDLDSDFFFYLGEKIAKGCKVGNENALITDFNIQNAAEDYQKIIAQWDEIKTILFSEECEGDFKFTLPDGYIHWLRYSEKYNHVYDKNFSHRESVVIPIDLEELYEESVEDMQRKILRTLKRNDLYLDIDEIVFNNDAVTRKSPIVRTIKDKYEGVGFKAYKKWMEEFKPQENIPDIGTPITNGEDDSNNDLTLLVDWICDEFKKEKAIDWRKDEVMMSKVYNITRNALNEYEASWFNSSVDIWIPYVAKCDSNGNPIHTTNFNRTLSKGLLHSLKHPDEVEDKSWGWEYVRYLGDGLTLKRHNYKYGLVDNYGIIIAQCEFNEIMQFKSGNIRLQKSGKFGLINKDKTINIPCIYDEIFDLEDGLAKVKIDGKWAKVNESGIVLWLRDDDKRWYYTCNNGIIHTQGITLGSTKISDLDYSKISSVTSKDIDDLSGDIYTPTLSDKVFFYSKKSSDAITLMNVENWASGDYEYDRLINTIHHLGLKPIYNNGNNICIYQTKDLLLKFLVVNNAAIFVEYSKSDYNIIESMQEILESYRIKDLMKTLYININNEQIQSNDELEVLGYDLDSDFFFFLGEKIAKGCKVENENALITDFNTQDTAEDYQKIIAQWDEIKTILFSEECEGKFDFTLPDGYIHWLHYREKYNHVYDKNFSHGEPTVITIDLEELYEESVEDMQRKILRTLKRNDLYLDIDEIVFNNDAVTRKSPIVHTIKEKYEGIGFKAYKKWLQDNEEKPHTTPQVCEKCGKDPCECDTNPISSDNFFPYKGLTLGKTLMKEFDDDLLDNGSIIHYDLDNGVTLLGATEGEVFLAAMVDSTISSNNKLPKEWCNLLGCRFGTFREKCRRALSEKDFEIILDDDAEIVIVSPSKKYRIHLAFDVSTSKFVALLITLNECPYCKSNNFALRKINAEMHISYCTDCDESYLPFSIDDSEDKEEDIEVPSCPNCGSDDVEDDGSDYLQYTCNDCGHNWGHDDTVECPECGSDDVENDGTDNLQYECNACGHMWGKDEVYDNDDEEDYYDDTDNSENIMSTYLDTLNIIPGITTKHDIIRQGGVFVKSEYGANADYYEMPNGVHVQFYNDIVCVIRFHENSWSCIPLFYKDLGLYWGIDKVRFRNIFEGLGFSVYDDNRINISASRYCEKYNKSVRIEITYIGGDMCTFSIW